MEPEEYPLLHYADLMLGLLRSAADGVGTLRDAVERLRRDVAAAGTSAGRDPLYPVDPPPIGAEDLLQRLRNARHHLATAGLVERVDGDSERLRLTDRGRQILADHPDGVDDTVLEQFAEFRAFVRRDRRGGGSDPHLHEFDQGAAAFDEGLDVTDNPYPGDSIQHLAWEQGWWESRDEAMDRRS